MVGRIASRRVSLLFHAPRFIKSNLKNLIRVYNVSCTVYNVHNVLYRIGDEDNWDMYASNWTLPLQWSLEIGIYLILSTLHYTLSCRLIYTEFFFTLVLNLFFMLYLNVFFSVEKAQQDGYITSAPGYVSIISQINIFRNLET